LSTATGDAARAEKLTAQQVLATTKCRSSTVADIRALLETLGDVRSVLRDADWETKAELYGALGLNLSYRPKEQVVDGVAVPTLVDISACRRGCVGGGT